MNWRRPVTLGLLFLAVVFIGLGTCGIAGWLLLPAPRKDPAETDLGLLVTYGTFFLGLLFALICLVLRHREP